MIELALQTQQEITYDEAWLYCITLDYNGHKDWRLPTANEYKSFQFTSAWHEGRFQVLQEYYVLYVIPVRTL
jgi:hypothetical protein